MTQRKINNLRLLNRDRSSLRHGTVLITTMLILFTLSSVVLVLSRRVAVESMASANESAAIQASAIERGGEQYVLALLTTNGQAVMDMDDTYFDAVQVGDGYFWLLRPNYGEDDLPVFGLVDEASKLGLNALGLTGNTAMTPDQLLYLPGMTEDVADAMKDWVDTDDDVTNTGAESDYYLALPQPYYCKNAPYESVEELLMVRGVYHDMLYGDGTAPPIGSQNGTTVVATNGGDPDMARGWYDLFTVNSQSPAATGGNTPALNRININTAPRAVLLTLQQFGMDAGDADSIVAYRQTNDVLASNDITWLSQAAPSSANLIRNYICGQSNRYSADILAVSGNGRAFKRVRIIVDSTTTPMTILSRRDITDQGWPMDPALLDQIRSGQFAQSGTASSIIGGGIQ